MNITYFAYGSNMHLGRLTHRVGEVKSHSLAQLKGYRLEFHKRGKDGSAKCDAFYTGNKKDGVFGVLIELDPSQKMRLDYFEGLGNGYNECVIDAKTATGTIEAVTYTAQRQYIDPGLRPFEWYKLLVIEGAKQHGLPPRYISLIENMPHIDDPDPERDQKNCSILKYSPN